MITRSELSQNTSLDTVTLGEGAGRTCQYLTFFLDGEEYGVDILSVQEIRGWEKTTSLPNTPSYIKGVINLRGTIVPITDLRERFCLQAKEYGALTVVIVLQVQDKHGSMKVVGIVVDAVSDVYDIPAKDIKTSPDLEQQVSSEFIDGLYNVSDKMLILLDVDQLLMAEADYAEQSA